MRIDEVDERGNIVAILHPLPRDTHRAIVAKAAGVRPDREVTFRVTDDRRDPEDVGEGVVAASAAWLAAEGIPVEDLH